MNEMFDGGKIEDWLGIILEDAEILNSFLEQPMQGNIERLIIKPLKEVLDKINGKER